MWYYRISACIITVELIKQIDTKWLEVNFNDICINGTYNIMYLYSNLQVWCIKMNKQVCKVSFIVSNSISQLLQKYNISAPLQTTCILDFYNAGELIGSKQITEELQSSELELKPGHIFPSQYNFVLYSDLTNIHNDKTVNKVRYEDIPKYFNYKVSNIKFVALILFYKDKEDMIELSTKEYNYYIVNNIIDKYFIMYYMKNILKYTAVDFSDSFKYKLTLYDHNVVITHLDENDMIVIGKDNYSVLKHDKQVTLDGFVIT